MRIEIIQVMDPSTQRVLFRSDVGTATGIWHSTKPAQPGPAYAELDIPDEISEWTLLAEPSTASIEAETAPTNGVHLTATVLHIGAAGDPVVTLNLGTDTIMIEMPDTRSDLAPGSTIRFAAPEIHLHPYEL